MSIMSWLRGEEKRASMDARCGCKRKNRGKRSRWFMELVRRERRMGWPFGRKPTHYLPNICGCRYSDGEGLTYHGTKVMDWRQLMHSSEAHIRRAVENVRFAEAMLGGPA